MDFQREKVYLVLFLHNLLLQADSSGSSVDPADTVEHMDVEESAESSHAGKKNQEDSQERSNVPPPNR